MSKIQRKGFLIYFYFIVAFQNLLNALKVNLKVKIWLYLVEEFFFFYRTPLFFSSAAEYGIISTFPFYCASKLINS